MRLLVKLLVLAIVSIVPMATACDSCEGKVTVTFYGNFCANGAYSVILTDDSYSANTQTAEGSSQGCAYGMTSVKSLKIKLGQKMTLKASPATYLSLHINLKVDDCYKVLIDGNEQTDVNFMAESCEDSHGERTWSVVVVPKSDNGGAGSGGNGSGGLGSVHWQFSMGGLALGESAGSIFLSEGTITASSSTPAELIYVAPSNSVEVLKVGGSLRQIKSPECLADIVTINSDKYEIRYYLSVNAGSKVSGLYVPSGSPYVTWVVQRPSGSPIGHLQINENRGSISTSNDFHYDSTTGDWYYNRAGRRLEELTAINLVSGDKLFKRIVSDPVTGIVALKTHETKHMFPWGMEVIERIEDPEGSPVTTNYTFYEDVSDGGGYKKLKSLQRSDGYWEYYQYSSSGFSFGNLVSTSYPSKDSITTPMANSPNVDAYNYYASIRGGDGAYGSVFFTSLGGRNLKRFGVYLGDTASTYASYGEDDNGIPVEVVKSSSIFRTQTETANYVLWAWPPFKGQTAWETFADGRRDTYSYSMGNYSNGSFGGSGSYSRKIVTHGTINDPNGISGESTQDTFIYSPAGLLLEESNALYTAEEEYALISKTIHGYDTNGKLNLITKGGRVVYEANWLGSRKQWERDDQGIQTTFNSYDALGRVESETRQGITTTYTYDAEGRVRTVTRTGGSLALSSSTTYDPAGRVISETTEEGLTTTTVYTNGERTVTRTLPGTGTEITDHYLDGTIKSITGTGVVAKYFDYGADGNGQWTKEMTGVDWTTSARWNKVYTNAVGDRVREVRPSYTGGTIESIDTIDTRGLLTKRTAPGEAPILFLYDELGQLYRQGRDVNGNGTLNLSGPDEVTDFEVSLEEGDGGWYNVQRTLRYEDSSGSPAVYSIRKKLIGGDGGNIFDRTVQIDRYGKTTTSTSTIDRTTKTLTTTTEVSDSSTSAVSIAVGGRLMSASTNSVLQPTVYEYDGLGRVDKITDPRSIITDPVYTGAVLSSITVAGEPTQYQYVPSGQQGAGQLFTTTFADGKTEIRSYDERGFLTGVSGTGVLKWTQYIDDYGDRTHLYTYRQPSVGDHTQWNYHPATGLLVSKTDALTHQVQYEYSDSNHLLNRWNARGSQMTYAYDERGNLKKIEYFDNLTPAVTIIYDRVNRPVKVIDGAGHHVLNYTLAEEKETITLGPLAGFMNSRQLDSLGRLKKTTAATGTWNYELNYGYDPATSRLSSVNSNLFSANYGYVNNSDLLETTTISGVLTSTREWTGSNRLKKIAHSATGGSRSFDTILFDDRNRRKEIVWEDNSKWTFGYDNLGQVSSGGRKWSDSTNIDGQQYGYGYDGAGNRSGTSGGIVNGRSFQYTANLLNQISSRTIPRGMDVIGNAASAATITVNNTSVDRKGGYFYKLLTAPNNSFTALIPEIKATLPSGTTTRTQTILLPATPENFQYDYDGNLTSDGMWTYTWDAENRLVAMESTSAVPTSNKRKIGFRYDWLGRRVEKWVSNSTKLHDHSRSIYNGWTLLAEAGDAGQPIRSYAWGMDVSGSIGGAGGVGGLLFERDHYGNKNMAVAGDLNGNVVRLIDSTNGQSVADYEYGPFGEVVRASGEYAELNPFGFSSKYTDWETGLLYYGYRYYNPSTGRWLSRDPIGERGGLNLYGFVGNNAVNNIDALGLKWDAFDFTAYFYRGKGNPINLSPIGYLEDVKAEIKKQGILDRFQKKRGAGSIEDEARKTGPKEGSFKANFKNSYDFSKVHYVFGSITLSGDFFGNIQCKQGKFEYKGSAIITFDDVFEDILDLKDHKNPNPIADSKLQPISNLGGTPYSIIEGWSEKFEGKL